MTDQLRIRPLNHDDLPGVARVLDDTGLFPADMLADIAAPFLDCGAPHHWLVAQGAAGLIGFVYCEPERMTDGTFNLLAIAVMTDRQGSGIGKAVVHALKARLREGGGRLLLVETSGLDEYAATRAFYAANGFVQEAVIRDFYTAGEDKVVFWKRL